ncbi:TlpA family protein disulfide reductase [Kangiella sediminilitoris]|uniref:Alkyl hydroperoxide reductase/ Thiol specific antioxidant/ Mal allergen n=1 Tax=Kangiella sediminilitoris TaxID=1144748 RepID=A0A1B3BB87_9GAMM|nr:TlpA disulfide reductase family protein [Kangiella sediminilitoris]AOE50071.1 Alkyl hydroperoxide reductase/ Thiol specific antioxidant/ Mal allergen [Kangiella sediminilitoris]
MKKRLYGLLVVFALVLMGCSEQNSFHLLSGKKMSMDDYKGQWLVINFWAEWCPPCLEEIPELGLLADENPDIAVLGVSYDKLDNSELKTLVDKLDIRYPIVATSPMPYLPVTKPQSLPGTYLVSPSGQTMGPILGKVDREKILEIIKKVEGNPAFKG